MGQYNKTKEELIEQVLSEGWFDFETDKLPTIEDILKEGSYLLYELEDVEETVKDDEGEEYTKKVSPLFSNKIINDENKTNFTLLSILTEETPFYFLEPSLENDIEDPYLSATRDCGVNDVPSPLQESNFYEHWFRDTFGFLQNKILLDVYNKLRWPFINENQYLSAMLFDELAAKAGFDKTTVETSSVEKINFRKEKDEFDDVSPSEYLDDIVNKKLISTYNMLDYNPLKTNYLSNMKESMVSSGMMKSKDSDFETSVYKLQDIKYELFRRKFAGSSSLYRLSLSSLGRRGSFIGALKVSDLINETIEYGYFRDKRLLRLVSLPGITSNLASQVDLNALDTYYYKPKGDGDVYIPLGVIEPLFYGSSNYNSGAFYSGYYSQPNNRHLEKPVDDYEQYLATRLRSNQTIIEWDSPEGILFSESIKIIPPKLDEYVLRSIYDGDTEDPDAKRLRKLDDIFVIPEDLVEIGESTRQPLKLDIGSKQFNMASVCSSFLDITVNKVLYHSNSLQKSNSIYNYVTYPIAYGNSLSLMDVDWLDYIQTITERKSKVNDVINYGAQISKYYKFLENDEVKLRFFTISYDNKDTIDITDISDKKQYNEITGNPIKYAYLWYCTQKYDATTKLCSRLYESTLISKILISKTLRPNDGSGEITYPSTGVLPFTYTDMVDSKVLGCNVAFTDGDRDVDDLDDLGYTKAYFFFSTYDYLKTAEFMNNEYTVLRDNNFREIHTINKEYEHWAEEHKGETLDYCYVYETLDIYLANFSEYISYTPSNEIKTVYYAVERENGILSWSEPIRVLKLNDSKLTELQGCRINPDWEGLCYYLNPYLNFTKESASPLRGKTVLPRYYDYDNLLVPEIDVDVKNLTGASSSTGLCSLVKMRHKDSICNDTGEQIKFIDNENSYYGFYLLRHDANDVKISGKSVFEYIKDYGISDFLENYNIIEPLSVYGDNRPKYKYTVTTTEGEEIHYYPDVIDLINNSCERTTINYEYSTVSDVGYTNPSTPSMLFKISDTKFESKVEEGKTDICISNYYDIVPCDTREMSESGKLIIYQSWFWDVGKTENYPHEMSFCMSIRPSSEIGDEVILLKREGEFSLKLLNKKSIEFVYGNENGSQRISYGLQGEETFENKLTRITATISSYLDKKSNENFRMTLCVNDKTETLNDIVNKIKLTYPNSNPIKVGYDTTPYFEVISDNVILHTDTCFLGSLYDLRLYNNGYSPEFVPIINSGTTRELYSYSPSIYKLGHTIYEDTSIIKVVNKSYSAERPLHDVEAIRYLSRGVWDSILIDTYPTSDEEKDIYSYMYHEDWSDPKDDTDVYKKIVEYKGGGVYNTYYEFNNTIQQYLEDEIEIFNNPTLVKTFEGNSLDIEYNRKKETISVTDSLTVLNTSVEPVVYNDYSFESENNKLDLNYFNEKVLLTGNINLPEKAIPCDGELSYKADIAFDFKILSESFFTSCLSKGTNINIKTINCSDEDNKYVVATISDVTSNSSNNNYITVPLTIPYQEESTDSDMLYLDRFYLDKVTLNNSIKKLLTATSYYNEYRTPINYIDNKGNSTNGYLWDAIRILKEGTYYFTCKYPIKILPLLADSNTNTNYSTFYASARFKIEVKGEPIEYNSQNIEYDRNNSEGYKGLVVTPIDNKDFPHRQINIDFYVMNVDGIAGKLETNGENQSENYSFIWEKIASNRVSNEDNLILLDNEFLKSGTTDNFVIQKRIPLFLEKSYTSPFFISKTEKTTDDKSVFNAKSADDDLIEPIIIKDRYTDINKELEKLWSNKEEDLDSQVIIAGRTYELMFDYEAKVSEISFTDKIFDNSEKIGDDSQEKINFARLTDITSNSEITENFEYMYTTDGKSFNFNDEVLYNNPCGFKTKLYELGDLGWVPQSQIDSITTSGSTATSGTIPSPFYFGNPYSRTRDKNYLLNSRTNSVRNDIENSYWFPYVPTDYNDKYLGYFGIYNGNTGKTRDFDGIKNLFNTKYNEVSSSIKSLSTSTVGLFTQLYAIAPNIIRQKKDGTEQGVNKVSSINADVYDLCGYISNNRTFNSLTNNIIIKRRGLYKNNLIKDQDFNNSINWEVYNPTMRNILDSLDKTFTVKKLGYDKLSINKFSLVNEPLWDKNAGKDVCSALITDYDRNNNFASIKYKTIFSNTTPCEISINMCVLQQIGTSSWEPIKDPSDQSVKVFVDFYNTNNKYIQSYPLMKGINSQGIEGWYNYSGDAEKEGQDITPPYSSYYIGFHFEVNGDSEEPTGLSRIINITKVIFRESTIKQHNLGFADVLKSTIQTEGQNSIVELARNMVVFKKKSNNEVVPIQFLYSVNRGTAEATSSLNFIRNYCGLTSDELSSKVGTFIVLTQPWVRRMSYKRIENYTYNPLSETSNRYYQIVHFYKPSVNIETADVLVESSDIISYNPQYNTLEIGSVEKDPDTGELISVKGIELQSFAIETETSNNRIYRLKQFDTNLLLDDPISLDVEGAILDTSPINMNNEKFSMIINCFDTKKYKDTSIRDLACVTNIQLICRNDDNEEEILYELEFLPIIYDERIHHLSTNILLHKESQVK